MEHVLILGLRSQFCERLALIAQQGACFLLGKNYYLCNMNARQLRHQILSLLSVWGVLSVVTLGLYWALWWIVDPSTFDGDGFSHEIVIFDLVYCIILTGVFMLIDLLFRSIFHKYLNHPLGFTAMAICMLVTNVCLALWIENLVERWIYHMSDGFVWTQGTLILGLIAAFLTILAIIHRHYQLMTKAHERNQQMEVQLLKKQLDPHFLFNNLSTVASTLDPDTQGYKMLQQLARVYRHVVNGLTQEGITLRDSMPVIESYVALINMRAPGHFIIDVDPAISTSEKIILPLSLQMLLENAMKHNKHNEEQPIRISIGLDNDWLTVKNTLRPNDVWQHSGHQGLENLKRRYRYITNRDIIVKRHNDYFEVKLPLMDNLPKNPRR